jgi:hypothetical protein
MGSRPFGPDARRPFDRPFVPFKLVSKSWEPSSFNKVPDCPSTYTTNVLRIEEKGTHRYVGVSPRLHTRTKRELGFPPLLHTYIRDYRSAPLCRDVFAESYVQ